MADEPQKIENDAFEILLKEMYGDMPLPDELKQQIKTAMETGQVTPEENEIPEEDRKPINTNALVSDLSSTLEQIRNNRKTDGCCG